MKQFFNTRKEFIKAISVLAIAMALILILGYVVKILPQKPDYIVTLHYYTLNDTFTVPVSYGIQYKKTTKLADRKSLIKTTYEKLSRPDNAYNKVIYSPAEDWELNNIMLEGGKLTLWLKSKQKYKSRGTSYDNNLLHSLVATYETVPDIKRLTLVFLDRDDSVISLGGGLDTSNIDFNDKKIFTYANIIQRYPINASSSRSAIDLKNFIPKIIIDNTRTQYVRVYLYDKRLKLLAPVDIAIAPDESPDDILLKTLVSGPGWLKDEYHAARKQYKIKSYNRIYDELVFFESPLMNVKIKKAQRLGGRVDLDMDEKFITIASNPKEFNRFLESVTHSYADSYSDLFDVKYFYFTVNGAVPKIKDWEYSTDKPMILKKDINLMDGMLWPQKK